MFKRARIKLTFWYLVIIMAISIFFSLIIYRGATAELSRIEMVQRIRRPGMLYIIDPDLITETKRRIGMSLFVLNLAILGISAASGYFLAGKTLEPIKKNMDEQKEFIGNASHELRTPLTSLKTEIEVALRDKRLGLMQAKKLLGSNLEDVNKMQKLSNYLLELNKYEKGIGVMKKVDLRDVVKKAAGKMKIKLDLKKSIITGNEDSLVELVTILIDNAVKYSPKNREIIIRTRQGGILEVEDRGAGISKGDLPHIFERFYRSDKSRGTDGYGLGLSIAKSIVDLHKGTIKVESKHGKGSTFRVELS